MRWVSGWLVAAAAAVVLAGGAEAQAPPSNPPSLRQQRAALDASIEAQLAARSRKAAELFRQANDLRARGDDAGAAALYRQLSQLVPDSDAALRRAGGEELALGHRAEAIFFLRRAVARAANADNLISLSVALSSSAGGARPSETELDESAKAASDAVRLAPKSYWAWVAQFDVDAAKGDLNGAEAALHELESLGPNEPSTWVYGLDLHAAREEWALANEALDKARQVGLDRKTSDLLSERLERAKPWWLRWLPAVWILVIWASVMPILFLCGWILSAVTIYQARNPANLTGSPQGLQLASRRAYRGILWLSCVYYWLSLPFLFLLVVGSGAAIVYFSITRHAWIDVPWRVVAGASFVAIATGIAIGRSVFVRRRFAQPGPILDLNNQPRLQGVLAEVAQQVGTRMVDTVFLTPGTDFAVLERGTLSEQLRGTAQRCMIIGIGLLEGMKVRPFKAVLAHEYGHFSNRDTAGGGFALMVRNSMFTMGHTLQKGGAAAWYNPAWLFFQSFYRGFLRVSQGASRLQEILADRWSASTYGSESFNQGLHHVIEQSVRFDARTSATLTEVVAKKKPLPNLYTLKPSKPPDEANLAQQIDQSLSRHPGPYDSHPSPNDRCRWVSALALSGQPQSRDDDDDVWTLFAGREEIERAMTAQVRAHLAKTRGVKLAASAAPRPPAPPPAAAQPVALNSNP